jgi:hypothetical protein
MDDGRRIPLSTRVSEATADALDGARGDLSPSAALAEALERWLAGDAETASLREEKERLAALAANLEADLEQERKRAPECRRCGEPLACPRCQGGGEYA